MFRREGQVIDEYERPVPGSTIFVFDQAGTAAGLFSDAGGTIPLPQPVLTDQFGDYAYYANSGVYREDTYYGGKLRYREVLPIGLDGLYPLAPRAGMYFAFDADGNPVASTGTGADAGLRADLALATGSNLVSWIRSAVGAVSRTVQDKLGMTIEIEDFGGGTTKTALQNSTALTAIATAYPGGAKVRLGPGNYSFDVLAYPIDNFHVWGTRGATTVTITGDGGGAPAAGVNGGVRMFGHVQSLHDLTLNYTNPALQCLLNASHAIAAGRITVDLVDYEVGVAAATDVNCVGIYMENLTSTSISRGQIGLAPNFKQNVVIRGFWNGCTLDKMTFRPNADDVPNSVFFGALPQVDVSATTRSSAINDCTFEQGPNGLRACGAGNLLVKNPYMADAQPSKGFWVPGLAVAQGDYIYPSAIMTTGSIDVGVSTTTLNVASAASLYVGQLLGIPGAGAAGAMLKSRITAITGLAVTIATAAATTVVAGNIYSGAYNFHGYRAMNAGTTGAAQPTWPTNSLDTVADNGITWREYGGCAWINGDPTGTNAGKDSLIVEGGNLFQLIAGIVSRRTTGGLIPQSVTIRGTELFTLDLGGSFDSVAGVLIQAPVLHSLVNLGFEFRTTIGATINNVVDALALSNFTGAAVVASTNSNSLGGLVVASKAPVGIGAAKFNYVHTDPTSTTGFNSATCFSVVGTKVVGARKTGWTVDTGTAKRTANATYAVGSALTVSAAYTQAEIQAIVARQVLLENAVRDATQTIKALKDDLHATAGHGVIGT